MRIWADPHIYATLEQRWLPDFQLIYYTDDRIVSSLLMTSLDQEREGRVLGPPNKGEGRKLSLPFGPKACKECMVNLQH